MAISAPVRDLLARILSWEDAHVSFDAALRDLPERLRGSQPTGLPYSAWQLLEHLRITQGDIFDFCVNPEYSELTWPDDYWPASVSPPSAAAWEHSVQRFNHDRASLQELSRNPRVDLEARIPHGSGQTYLRELLLAADHAAYHVGQLVAVRRLLGCWPPGTR